MANVYVLDEDERDEMRGKLILVDKMRRQDSFNTALYYLIETFQRLLDALPTEETR